MVEHLRLLLGGWVKAGQQQLSRDRRPECAARLLLVDQLFLHHVAGDLHGRGAGALAVASLQHVQRAASRW